MLIPYILSGSITVLSQRSTAASKDARSGRPGLAPRPADPAVNVPGFPRFAAARADLRWGASQAHPRVPGEHRRRRYRAGRWAGSSQEAPDRSWAPLSSRCGDLLLAVLGILAGAVLCAGWGFGNVAGWDVAGATPEVRPE